MNEVCARQETRIIPEETSPKFLAQHLKPYEFFRKEVTEKTVLEIGCGDGYGCAYLAEIAKSVIGIDYDEDIILEAQNKYKRANLRFIQMNADNLQFADNSFDLVCSFQVIEHISEEAIGQYLRETKRVLREGGEFYLSTLNLEHVMKSPYAYKKQPAHCKEFRLEELKSLLSKIFPNAEIYGLGLTPKHRFYQRLKKIGIFNLLPERLNPVSKFYQNASTKDFKINSCNLKKAIDFICVCSKEKS